MPTTLPARSLAPNISEDLAGFGWALIRTYAAIAILLLSLTAVESYFGMFAGLTLAESILKATGTDLPAP